MKLKKIKIETEMTCLTLIHLGLKAQLVHVSLIILNSIPQLLNTNFKISIYVS